MTVTLKIRNGPSLIKALSKLEEKVEKRIGKKAVRAGGSEYAKLVRQKIPKSSKDDIHLKKSISVVSPKGSKFGKTQNQIRVQVGVRGPARHYAHIWEYGKDGQAGTRVFTDTLKASKEQIFERIKKTLSIELGKI